MGTKRRPARVKRPHDGLLRIALYLRVSTDEQRDTGTIETQRTFFQNWIKTYTDFQVADWYIDNGVSGTIPLVDRPEGKRLMDDAAAGRFDSVVVYKLDRLARTLRNLLTAHEDLEQLDITIKSANEPFDTSSDLGRLVFQLLGSLAEFERSTILTRTASGLDRIVYDGLYTGGAVPYGYDVATDHRYVPSERMTPVGKTEAEIVQHIFAQIDSGATLYQVVRWLNAHGIDTFRRYGNGQEITLAERGWTVARLAYLVHNPVYKGVRRWRQVEGRPEPPTVPWLVRPDRWDRVQQMLPRNRRFSNPAAPGKYLLSGLVFCITCEGLRTGRTASHRPGQWRYYVCRTKKYDGAPDDFAPCPSFSVRAEAVEDAIWSRCRGIMRDPASFIQDVQDQLRDRIGRVTDAQRDVDAVQQRLKKKDRERSQITTLYVGRRISLDEAERLYDGVDAEIAEIQAQLAKHRAQQLLVAEAETHFVEMRALLARGAAELEEIERTNDRVRMREIIETLVARVCAGDGVVEVEYHFQVPSGAPESNMGFGLSHERPGLLAESLAPDGRPLAWIGASAT